MKKVINGKMYNTDTASELAMHSSPGSWRDFSHWEETLYRKKTGEFFLYGEGGPMTRYAEETGTNAWTGGERIMPLTYADAQNWAEKYLDGDDYESIFGEVIEDDTKVVAAYRLPTDLIEVIKRRAAQDGVGISDFVESLLRSGLKQK